MLARLLFRWTSRPAAGRRGSACLWANARAGTAPMLTGTARALSGRALAPARSRCRRQRVRLGPDAPNHARVIASRSLRGKAKAAAGHPLVAHSTTS
jgi:hypothetical protein